MPLTLKLTAAETVPLEVEGITPAAVEKLSAAEVARLPVRLGNRPAALGELFEVTGSGADGGMVWEGDLAGVHYVGAGMRAGEVLVRGNVGRHAGSGMRGGKLRIEGTAGDWLGAEMRGGKIDCQGDAGDHVGGAYVGNALGMKGGEIIVRGSAGDEVGANMRRGMIVVAGRLGHLAGVNMRAGTIGALGPVGTRYGSGMRRGTLVFLGERPAEMLPTFRQGSCYRPQVLDLLVVHWRRLGLQVDEQAASGMFDLFHGDVLEGGRGEMFLRVE